MKRMTFAIVFGIVFISLLGGYLWWHGSFSKKGDITTVGIKGVEFMVELAETPAERSRGLSGHAPLKENEGMLFVFERAEKQRFWMKGMLFSIDIIWIEDGAITGIEKNAPVPEEGEILPRTYSSPGPVEYVLEVPAGTADRYGLTVGDEIVLGRQ